MKSVVSKAVAGWLPPPFNPQRFRLWVASVLTVCGMMLLFMGFWVKPIGEIHQSILLAYGEVMTFVGALIGIDYAARERMKGMSDEE